MQIANVWHFGLRLTNTAFKPALGELRKEHPVCTKIRLFEIQNRISPQTSSPVWRDTTPFGASILPPTVPTLLF